LVVVSEAMVVKEPPAGVKVNEFVPVLAFWKPGAIPRATHTLIVMVKVPSPLFTLLTNVDVELLHATDSWLWQTKPANVEKSINFVMLFFKVWYNFFITQRV